MKKIPTLFVRDLTTGKIRNEVTPGAEWVIAGEGIPTRKWDGTCVRIEHDWAKPGLLVWTRREVKRGKTPPPNFVPVTTDDNTGKVMGWEPYTQSGYVAFLEEALGLPERCHRRFSWRRSL